jgi:hypothetical protein
MDMLFLGLEAKDFSMAVKRELIARATGTHSRWPFKYVMRTINYWDNTYTFH